MKKINNFLLAFFAFALFTNLIACTPTKSYMYSIKQVKPISSESLHFENDTFGISFTFKNEYIGLEIQNKLDNGLQVNWDELNFAINGETKRVSHFEINDNKITRVQPPKTIPPNAKLRDAIVETDKISFKFDHGKEIRTFGEVLPKSDNGNKQFKEKILNLKDKNIVIYFPYQVGNKQLNRVFEFQIEDVSSK